MVIDRHRGVLALLGNTGILRQQLNIFAQQRRLYLYHLSVPQRDSNIYYCKTLF